MTCKLALEPFLLVFLLWCRSKFVLDKSKAIMVVDHCITPSLDNVIVLTSIFYSECFVVCGKHTVDQAGA